MIESEWIELAAKIDAWWPATEFGEDSEAAYFLELREYEIGEVEWAVRMCLRDGSAFAPSLAQVLQHLDADVGDIPTFRAAWQRIRWAVDRSHDETAMQHSLRNEHAIISDFAATYGFLDLKAECREQGGDFAGAALSRVERAWREHVAEWGARRRQASTKRAEVPRGPRKGELRRPEFELPEATS